MDASEFVPANGDLDTLAAAAQSCRGCELYADATQAVFGAGRSSARVVLVGEQPGDAEDRQGKPFVGPAGRMLDKALEQAGIDRADAYVTNAVKHFRFETGSGTRRLHKKPDQKHIVACKPWLEAEFRRTGPDVVVALGATAVRALFGTTYQVTKNRGVVLPFEFGQSSEDHEDHRVQAVITVHPSAILRSPSKYRDDAYQQFVADLRVAAGVLS